MVYLKILILKSKPIKELLFNRVLKNFVLILEGNVKVVHVKKKDECSQKRDERKVMYLMII